MFLYHLKELPAFFQAPCKHLKPYVVLNYLFLSFSERHILSFDATNSDKVTVAVGSSVESKKLSKLDKILLGNKMGVEIKYAPILGEDDKFHPGNIDGSEGNPPLVHLYWRC